MSTRAEIMAELATIFGRPKSSVEAVDRVLTDAGLRTRAARGLAAQAMSAENFANVTIGLMGGWSLRETSVVVERLGGLLEFRLGPRRYTLRFGAEDRLPRPGCSTAPWCSGPLGLSGSRACFMVRTGN